MDWTAENLDKMASSRILRVCSLIDHHKDQAARPLFFRRDGMPDPVQEAANGCKPAEKPRKFLILVLYEEQRTIMKHVSKLAHICSADANLPLQVFKLRGDECIEYDGRMSPKARDEAVKQFETRDDLRIMIMSSVGTTGLNLTCASVVIFMVSSAISHPHVSCV